MRKITNYNETQDNKRYRLLRENMIEEQIVSRGISDKKVLEALRKVPRHIFVDKAYKVSAYEDRPLPIGSGQTISQPYIVALMTEGLELTGNERVLEIGTGSGYQVAVLAELVKEVYTVEIITSLHERNKKLLSGYKNLNELLDASISELTGTRGIGLAKAAQVMAALELGRRAVSEKNGNTISYRCSEEIANYYIPLLKDLKKEQFRVLLLDVKNKVIKEVLISQGSLTSSLVHLATIFFAGRVEAIAHLA